MVKKVTVGEELEEKVRRKNKGGQGNRGRQPGMTGAPKKPTKKPSNGGSTGGSNGGSKSSTSNKSSDGDRDVQGAIKAGIALSKSLANASGAKKYRDAGIEAFKGTPVVANDGGTGDSMDITTFNNAYGSRNADNTGVDMGDLKAKDLELTPAEKKKLNQYNSYNVG